MSRELLTLEAVESVQQPLSPRFIAVVGGAILAAFDRQSTVPVNSESFDCPNGGTCSSGFCNGGSDCLEVKNPWPKPEK